MAEPTRALPVITDLTRPFWEAARAGTLAIQRCGECGYYNHPPREACDRCLSGALAFELVSGKGRVWSFAVMHQGSVVGFEERVPYLTALVELDEQPMLLLVTNLAGPPERVRLGQRVSVTFEPFGDGLALPQFVIDEGGAQ